MVAVTGAFLAERAGVLDGKLHVWGGILDTWTVDSHRVADWVLVVLLQHPLNEPPSSDPPTLGVEIHSPAGDLLATLSIAVGPSAMGGENAFVFLNLTVEVPIDGRYAIVVAGDGSNAAVPVTVRSG